MKSSLLVGLVFSIFLAGAVRADDQSASSQVTLGVDDLTSGVPGEGPLTVAQLRQWLADPKNHEPLTVSLPMGLASGQASIFIPEDNPLTRAKIELGRQLYFDPRLSVDSSISCASCHHPDSGYARETQFGVGIQSLTGNRNSPTSFNRILSRAQFWDGRAATLEDQAIGPIANPIEMGFTHDSCIARLQEVEGYRLQFESVFPKEGFTIATVGKAIASFERAIVTGPSPADYYEPLRTFENQFREVLADVKTFAQEDPDSYDLYRELKQASDAHPISDAAKRGRELFFSEKGGCTACHVGANFTDEQYHNLGIGMNAPHPDLGRYEQTRDDKDRGAFKTPTVRNVALTGPYMHDGSLKTLEEVVEWYDKGGHPNPWLSDKVKKLNLTQQEKSDLVAYMQALTGPFPKVRQDRLPE
jgi:cytochrome c peroxidase